MWTSHGKPVYSLFLLLFWPRAVSRNSMTLGIKDGGIWWVVSPDMSNHTKFILGCLQYNFLIRSFCWSQFTCNWNRKHPSFIRNLDEVIICGCLYLPVSIWTNLITWLWAYSNILLLSFRVPSCLIFWLDFFGIAFFFFFGCKQGMESVSHSLIQFSTLSWNKSLRFFLFSFIL